MVGTGNGSAGAYGTRGYEQGQEVIPWGERHYVIYKRADIGGEGSWFLRYHIKEEGRHFRKSLRTADVLIARRKALNEMVDLTARIKNGQKIISPTLDRVVREFAVEQEELQRSGQLAPRTVVMQRYRVGLGCAFIKTKLSQGMGTRIAEIKGDVFDGYLKWRTDAVSAKGRTIRRDVVRDELLVIRKVFTFAHKKKLCSERAIPTWSFPVESEGPKRRRMTPEDFDLFGQVLKSWAGRASGGRDAYNRLLLLHFVRVLANTGLRSGELFNLRNRDVQVNRSAQECVLNVRREYSKVRKDRVVTLGLVPMAEGTAKMPFNYLIHWLDKVQRHKAPGDYLFAPYHQGNRDVRDVYYHLYKSLRKDLKKVGLEWFDTYHCRHSWITEKLRQRQNIHLVARAAGTSTQQIEQTYSHISTEMTTRDFGRAALGEGIAINPA